MIREINQERIKKDKEYKKRFKNLKDEIWIKKIRKMKKMNIP